MDILKQKVQALTEQMRDEAKRPASRLYLCGVSHHATPIEIRERYSLAPEQVELFLKRLRAETGIEEAMMLSTCNRVEVYAFSDQPGFEERLRERFLSIAPSGEVLISPPGLYQHEEARAVRHLFAVESGLYSMILGENQIKQQVKQAMAISESLGMAGRYLHPLIRATHRTGKRVRNETALNTGSMGVSSACVMQGEKVLGTLAGKRCLIVGAGKIARIAARLIAERQPEALWIVNRTLERACELADPHGGEGFGLDKMDDLLPCADFVLAAAYSPLTIITRGHYERLLGLRSQSNAVCMIDAAVPRTIDPELGELPEIHLHDIEQLEEIVELNRNERATMAEVAWELVEEELDKYTRKVLLAQLGPSIEKLQEQFTLLFDEETPRLLRQKIVDCSTSADPAKALAQLKQNLLYQAIAEIKDGVSERSEVETLS